MLRINLCFVLLIGLLLGLLLSLEFLFHKLLLFGLVLQFLFKGDSLFLRNLHFVFCFDLDLCLRFHLLLGDLFGFLAGLLMLMGDSLSLNSGDLFLVSPLMCCSLESLLLSSLCESLFLSLLFLRCSLQSCILGLGLKQCLVLFLKLLDGGLLGFCFCFDSLTSCFKCICLGFHSGFSLRLNFNSHLLKFLFPCHLFLACSLICLNPCLGISLYLNSHSLILFGSLLCLMCSLCMSLLDGFLSFILYLLLLFSNDFIYNIAITFRCVTWIPFFIKYGLITKKVIPVMSLYLIILDQFVSFRGAY